MKVVYSDQKMVKSFENTVFLAGPTPRSKDVQSWRKEAIEIFRRNGFNGTLLIPEPTDGSTYPEYDNQFDWETEGLDNASCIMFWIPRKLDTMPAFTTNIEWGIHCKSGRVVVGFPKDSEKNRYIEMQCETYLNLNVNRTLEDTIKEAIKMAAK